MSKTKLEYIWLDGYTPTQSLRSKTKIVRDFDGTLDDCPAWCFDGSSTEQAPGGSSDCILTPVALYPDPGRKDAFLVMCEVMSPDGSPHPSNGRVLIEDDDRDFWFGFEQEYFLWNPETAKPLGFPENGYPAPQGQYYCSVGAKNAFGIEGQMTPSRLFVTVVDGVAPDVVLDMNADGKFDAKDLKLMGYKVIAKSRHVDFIVNGMP